MTCLHCTHLNLQRHPDHAKVGLARCALDHVAGRFNGMQHNCMRFATAAQDVIEKREEWHQKNIQKGNASGNQKT